MNSCKLTVKLTTAGLAFFLGISVGPGAEASRYMVVFKDRDLFNQASEQLRSGSSDLGKLSFRQGKNLTLPFAAFADARIQIQGSLNNLQTVVIEADSVEQAQALAKSNKVLMVEKEIFHPAPKPVHGFKLTTAWSYDLKYATSSSALAPTPGIRADVGPKTPWGIIAVHAPEVWAMTNQGGAARVMVLDSGIDKDHPALKDNFEKGRDFSGETAGLPYPFADKEGHGTHVSGTIAGALALNGFAGVAPQAKILMGKVCGEGGCSNIGVAAGMNWAISEKVDVVSMSLGGPVGTGAERRAVEALEAAGITVVAASGNDGTPQVSYPAAFSTVVAVGAIDKTLAKAKFSQWGPELAIMAPGVEVVSTVPQGSSRESRVEINGTLVLSTSFSGAPEVPKMISNELVLAGLGKPGDYTPAVIGKFALVSRGEITFSEKVKNAITAGAAGIVIYNNEPGLMQGALTQDGSTVAIPVVMIEQEVGQQAKVMIAAGQVVKGSLQTAPADYASFAGTSMATPHVAGVVALVKTANKSLLPAQIRSLLKSTATAMAPTSDNQHGAGLINAEKAVQAALAIPGRAQ